MTRHSVGSGRYNGPMKSLRSALALGIAFAMILLSPGGTAWAQVAEYAPLYGLLVLPLLPRARAGLARLALRIRDGRRAPSRASA